MGKEQGSGANRPCNPADPCSGHIQQVLQPSSLCVIFISLNVSVSDILVIMLCQTKKGNITFAGEIQPALRR